jgi:signal transduction histidine kinase/CheY-like chemotaxis protein
MISYTMRTEELLQEVKHSNAELEAQAKELEEKAKLLEIKNHEVELASLSLEEKAEQLSLISKYKSEFLANMSHELRTPLNSLLILSKMLSENKDGNLRPEQIKFASTIYSAGCDLLSLINEILDLSKVEAGKMPIEPKTVDIFEVKESLDQSFRPVAEHKGLKFVLELDPEIPNVIYTDSIRLHQILKNLLSNAMKFTDHGSVSLRVRPETRRKNFSIDTLNRAKHVVAFVVQDTGIGIPAEKQSLIFEAFQQADGTTSRKYGGTGLGLTISREIARLLGGVIEVDSTPGVGSTFTLYLPDMYIAGDPSPRQETPEAERVIPPLPGDATFDNRKILIMDDDSRNIFAIRSVLESRGARVLHAENGEVGLKLLGENPDVDLVLMDIMMPRMDGFVATQKIREQASFKDLPIISLTAKAMKGDREKCLEAGASDYITKPVDPEKLLSLIHSWLRSSPN